MSGQQRHLRPQPPTKPDAVFSDSEQARESPPTGTLTASGLLHYLGGCGDAVAAIGAALALSPDRLARAEALDRLELDADLPLSVLDAVPAPTIAGWFTALGSDLRIDATLSGGSSQVSSITASLRAGRDPAQALADFLDTAHQAAQETGDEVTVNLRLAVAKARALETTAALLALRPEYLGTPEMLAHTTIAVFYSSAAFHRLIGLRALADWERLGLAREDGRAVVVLCDQAGYLAGPSLEIVGASADIEPRWLPLSRAGFRQFRQRTDQTRALRDEEGGWATAPRVLTPAHLRVSPRAPGLEDTATRLTMFQSGLAAAYLAASVHTGPQGELLLRFAGPRPAICRIPAKTATAPSPLPDVGAGFPPERSLLEEEAGLLPAAPARPGGNADIPAESATVPPLSAHGEAPPETQLAHKRRADQGPGVRSSLVRLCAWAYDNASPDKLAIARECLSGELPHGADISLAGADSAAAGALETAKANFTLYLRRNTEQYFSIRQKALDAVTDYAAGVRKAVSDLTGEVVDNVFRTAGLLVGVVIAALIQPSLSLGVARLASLLYTAYIALLVGYYMRARWRRFELEQAGLEERLAAMPELGASVRDSLRRQPADAETYFTDYFRRAWWIYVCLGVLGLLTFLLLWTPLAPLTGIPHSPLPTPTHVLNR